MFSFDGFLFLCYCHLMKQEDYCKKNCIYLKKFSEQGKLPFYCDLFKCFLASKKTNIIKTEACLGKHLGTKESGYQLISSYQSNSINKQMTKWGFHRLDPKIQTQFVHVIHQMGNEIGVQQNTPLKDKLIVSTLVGQIKMVQAEMDNSGRKETNSFNEIIDKLGEDFPTLLNDEKKNLLNNLFAVLDKSEQSLLMDVLSSPEKVENFLKSFDEMSKGDNLLKDLRRELSEIEKEMEEERLKRLQGNLLQMQMHLNNRSR